MATFQRAAHYPLPAAVPRRSLAAWARHTALAVALSLGTAGLAVAIAGARDWAHDRTYPPVAPPDLAAALADERPVTVTITTPTWDRETVTVTVDTVRSDRRLWRQMHLGDWDAVSISLRERALETMLVGYAPVLRRAEWEGMGTADWDVVPQPMRAAAYLRMVHHWTAARAVGAEFGYSTAQMAQTIAAIVMAESWFEHRAFNENRYGNRDLGLAQCSDYCRRTVAAMAEAGELPFAPTDADYFDPRIGSYIATIWFERELQRAEGDVSLAIRAYHRGLDAAMDEKGDLYLAKVERLRDQYIRTQRASPSWAYLTARIMAGRAPLQPHYPSTR